jgi:hypothetical protein
MFKSVFTLLLFASVIVTAAVEITKRKLLKKYHGFAHDYAALALTIVVCVIAAEIIFALTDIGATSNLLLLLSPVAILFMLSHVLFKLVARFLPDRANKSK